MVKISERALASQARPDDNTGNAISVGGMTFKSVKQAVVPTLRQAGNEPVAFTIVERMRVSKQLPPDKNGQVMPRATALRVRSLTNGRLYDYIVPSILVGTFIDDYSGGKRDADGDVITIADGELAGYNDYSLGEHTYVGKSFVVQKGTKPDGKRYREVEAMEIDPSQVEIQG